MDIKKKSYEEVILDNRSNLSVKEKNEKPIAVIAAIAADVMIAIVKFIAAAVTGSSAMISEGIHSLVDTSNAIIVLIGQKAAKKKPTITHPFGYGKELYYYSFIVSILILSVGGGASLLKGIQSMASLDTIQLGDPTLNYIVCFFAMFFEGCALAVTIKTIRAEKGEMSMKSYIKNSKDPSNFIVLFEDSSAEIGLIAAIIGVFLSHQTNNPAFDASSSIFIGLLLIVVAIIVLKETKHLLIGEGLSLTELKDIRKIVQSQKHINKCGRILSIYIGPNDLLLTLDVNFKKDTTLREINLAVNSIEKNILEKYPEASRIFIEVDSLKDIAEQEKEIHEAIEKANKPEWAPGDNIKKIANKIIEIDKE